MIKNILMICIGNICRSPMAEGLLRQRLMNKPEINISSAGIKAMVGHSADAEAQAIMKERANIDLSQHRARQLTSDLLLKTDLILVMETAQQTQIEFELPSICGRVHRLGKWNGIDISDPYRRPKQAFEQAYLLIEQSINDWQARLWK